MMRSFAFEIQLDEDGEYWLVSVGGHLIWRRPVGWHRWDTKPDPEDGIREFTDDLERALNPREEEEE